MACLKRVDKCLWSRRPVLITDRYIHGLHEAPREDFKKQPRIREEKAVRIKEKRLPAPLYEAENRKKTTKQLSQVKSAVSELKSCLCHCGVIVLITNVAAWILA